VAAVQTSTPSAPPKAEAPVAANNNAQVPIVENQAEQPKEQVSGAPVVAGQPIVHTEERVEYRDQDGNLLDEEQVKALEGKVEFKTRYETRTRVVDAAGHEVVAPAADGVPVAPPHPDVEGVDKETPKKLVADESIPPVKKSVEGQKEAEEKVKVPKPASEGNEATAKKDEL